MNKREYYRERKKLIKGYETGKVTYGEFTTSIVALARHFNPRWQKEISSQGKTLGMKIMKLQEEN